MKSETKKTIASAICGIAALAASAYCQEYDVEKSTPIKTDILGKTTDYYSEYCSKKSKKPSFLDHANPFYTYENKSKTDNWIIKAGKTLGYLLVANELMPKKQQDPYSMDSDRDGMSDGYERDHGLNPSESNTGKDTDNDGYDDILEYREGSHPNNPDSKPQDDAWTELSVKRKKTASAPGKAYAKKSRLETYISPSGINFAIPLKRIIIYGTAGKNPDINIRYNHRF